MPETYVSYDVQSEGVELGQAVSEAIDAFRDEYTESIDVVRAEKDGATVEVSVRGSSNME